MGSSTELHFPKRPLDKKEARLQYYCPWWCCFVTHSGWSSLWWGQTLYNLLQIKTHLLLLTRSAPSKPCALDTWWQEHQVIQTASCCFHWSCASFLQRAAHGAPDQTAGCAQDSRCRAPLIRSCQLECGLWRGAISGLEFLLEKWRGEWEGGSRWWIKITMDPTFAKSPTTSARVFFLDSRGTVPLGFLIPTSTTNVCVCVCARLGHCFSHFTLESWGGEAPQRVWLSATK